MPASFRQMKLGFIGCGKMGSALVQGVLKARLYRATEVYVTDKIDSASRELADKTATQMVPDAAAVSAACDIIILCVKPDDAADALQAARNELCGKLLISIVAGLRLDALKTFGGGDLRVARVMPNTPALIHRGAAAYALSPNTRAEDASIVEQIFSAVGKVFRVEERLLDVVTGLSGSGPAYIYVVIEALADAGVLMGLPRDLSLQLSAQTTAGAAEMILQTGMHPAQLKDMVASPGGTTIAGLEALEAGGLRTSIIQAVRAATERARELGAGK
jgi:pyrroline-5-carboxylate reductase